MSRPASIRQPTLVFATRNRGKLVELKELLAGTGLDVIGFDDLDGDLPEVIEDAETFIGNASKKAREIALYSRLPSLADDSGLEVDALDGRPGVWSARYAGERADDRANNAKLLAELKGVPMGRRTARFRSALVFADPGGPLGEEVLIAEGSCEGEILQAPRGLGGFGYDPLFFVPSLGKTFAELGVAAKNDLSHRAMAMAAMKPKLLSYYGLAKGSGSR